MSVTSNLGVRPKRRKFRLRGATRIAVYFVAIAGIGYLVWNFGVCGYVASRHYPNQVPGRVDLVALDPSAGFKVFIEEGEVQLIQTGAQGFQASDSNLGLAGGGSKKLYLPLRALLGALQGHQKALSRFVMEVNELGPDDHWPIRRIVWKAEDIQKALNGDPQLMKKLETQLNMTMSGKPMPFLNTVALENGIIVDTPCPIQIKVGDQTKTIVARVERPFRPDFLKEVLQDYSRHGDPTKDQRAIYYANWLAKFKQGKVTSQNIGAVLESMITPDSVSDYAKKAEKILKATHVILTNRQIENASDTSQDINGDKLYTLNLNLTNNGRMRLWKYSIQHPGGTLLLVSDGIAIAAPTVNHQLMWRQVSVSQMSDPQIVSDAVQKINGAEAH